MKEFGVITSNASADFLDPPGVPPWDERKSLYAQLLREAEPALIGLQEVTPRQLEFLQTQLPEFTALSVPVIDPDPAMLTAWQAKYGRFGFLEPPSPYEIILFYQTNIFDRVAQGHWWLSPTPERPSTGFGNTAPRVVLWARLLHRPTGQEMVIFNTHIDHRCPTQMVELCREKFAAFETHAVTFIFIGDLNFNPSDPNYTMLIKDGWRDSHDVNKVADSATFLYNVPNIPAGRIDHILYRGEGLIPLAWQRLFSPDPDRRLSDHDPVYGRFSLE